jgi:response regulator RpfG family c-di-GMP phosphodiesterase
MRPTNESNRLLTIILIDDNVIDLFICEKIIQSVYPNCNIIAFQNGNKALVFLKSIFKNGKQSRDTPDLILLDLFMPCNDGFDFLTEYELISINVKHKPLVIIVSCSLDPSVQIKCMEYKSVTEFISKPLSKNKIVNVLNENAMQKAI